MEQFLTSLAPSVEASFLSGTADCGEGEATHLIRLRRESQKSMIKTCFEGLIHFENVLCHAQLVFKVILTSVNFDSTI